MNRVQAAGVIRAWLGGLPSDCTWERVRDGFWYVRIPGQARRWIPLELSIGSRTVTVVSHVIVEPVESQAEVYQFLLRTNFAAGRVAFAFEGAEGVICLVGRMPLAALAAGELDELVGAVVETTEKTFRSILQLGFGSLLKGSSGS
ncbi:MAG TPA: hypothetical protein VNE62_06130 [Actinomycetota bacterium]|nr:hypothetical protein [Actinomycetota bacterium]